MIWSFSQLILNRNRSMNRWITSAGRVVWSVPTQGVTIHRISPLQADLISTAVKRGQIRTNIPATLGLAFLGHESFFDPACINMNGKPKTEALARVGIIEDWATANTDTKRAIYRALPEPADWDRTDMGNWDCGVAQHKLYYLSLSPRTNLNGDLPAALVYAQDLTLAIEEKFAVLVENLEDAKKFLREEPKYIGEIDPWMLAVESYNKGRNGAKAMVRAGLAFTYAPMIATIEQQYALRLGKPSALGDRLV